MKKLKNSHTHTHIHSYITDWGWSLKAQSVLLLLLSGTLLFLQSGCEVDPLKDPRETFQFGDVTVTTYRDMMHFESRADFQEVMKGTIAKRFNPSASGAHFRSMQQIINEIPADTLEIMDQTIVAERYSSIYKIVQDREDKFLRPVIDSRPMRSIVNSEGNLAIGDTVYHFTYDKTYAIEKSKFTNTNSLITDADRISNVVRISGNRKGVRGVIDCIDYYGGEKRKQQRKMKGELWDYNNTVYQEISVGVENFDKNLAHIWKKDDATNIWLQGYFEVVFYDSYQGWVYVSDNVNEHEEHESDIEIIIISRVLDGNTLGNVNWDGTDMLFKADEKDDSEVRHDDGVTGMPWDEALCEIVE